eukprot:3439614-Pleurochrysis_carterae.AAC.1
MAPPRLLSCEVLSVPAVACVAGRDGTYIACALHAYSCGTDLRIGDRARGSCLRAGEIGRGVSS